MDLLLLSIVVVVGVANIILYWRNADMNDEIRRRMGEMSSNENQPGQDWQDADDPDRRTLD